MTRAINIPYKCLAFCDKVIEVIRSFVRHIFDEIRRTGEFTVTFKVIRSVHDQSQEKFENKNEPSITSNEGDTTQ